MISHYTTSAMDDVLCDIGVVVTIISQFFITSLIIMVRITIWA
jgi:hypothetical protein